MSETSTALTVRGGVGLTSKRLVVKPDRILLVQPTSKEGTPGRFRFASTGEEFSSLQLVHLKDDEGRQLYLEGASEMKKDNLICFSTDGIVPHSSSRVRQNDVCAGCPKSDWTKWRASHKVSDLPPCKEVLNAMVLERSTGLPYFLSLKGRSITNYDEVLQSIARECIKLQAKGENPNVFDFSFELTTEKYKAYYVVKMASRPGLIKAEDRSRFGELYERYVSEAARGKFEAEEAAREADIETELSEGEYVV